MSAKSPFEDAMSRMDTPRSASGYVADQMRRRQANADHKQFLAERPDSNSSREECAKKLFELATKVFEQAKKLKENGKIDSFTKRDSNGNPLRDDEFAKLDEDETKGIKFNFSKGIGGATTLRRVINYLAKEGKGTVSTWFGGPAGMNDNVINMTFWTGEGATSKGTLSMEAMADEDLAAAVSVVTKQFEEALHLIEARDGKL